MKELKERIISEGKVLPGEIIKVDGFLNHKIDCQLVSKIADEFEKKFDISDIDIILTAEASGIAIAAICSLKWKIPMIFAKKSKSDNIEGGLYKSEIYSYTHKEKFTLLVSKEWLKPNMKILIIDDFIANGQAVRGLIDIANQANADIKGIGIVIEKEFQAGGDMLRKSNFNYCPLAVIKNIKNNKINFK